MNLAANGTHGRRARTLAALATTGLLVALAVAAVGLPATTRMSALSFHDGMRKLWEDHATWTRLVIVGFIGDLPNTGATVERLLQNQVDIGDAIKPFYGEAAGTQLTLLLQDHIGIAAQILGAAKVGDAAALNDALARWYANAEEIATFLSVANPRYWPSDMMRSMMREHLDLTLPEAVAEIEGNYAASVAAYDVVHEQILHMADMLSTGIIAQFPGRFVGAGLIFG